MTAFILTADLTARAPLAAAASIAAASDWPRPSRGHGVLSWLATVLTNGGRSILTARVKTTSQTEPLNIGWGTGAGTSAATDTTLFTEVDPGGSSTGSRTSGTSAQVTTTVTNDTYQVTGTRAATAALSITNAGLWDNAAIGSGALFLKGDFASIGLASGDSIAFTIKLQFT
jgi:hypothetical protein